MRKIIIGLSGIILMVLVVIFFTNAKSSHQEGKKAATEMTRDCGKCPSASACTKSANSKCDPAKCKEKGCDPAKCKEGKCEHAASKSACCGMGETKKCDHSTGSSSDKK